MAGYANQSEFQQATNFYDLAFTEETSRYIYRIAALKYIVSSAKSLGMIVPGSEAYRPIRTKSIMVDATVSNLSDFAISHGSNYKMLKLMNPWLRAHSLPVKPGKSYTVELPVETADDMHR
jgi:hypothetical protein